MNKFQSERRLSGNSFLSNDANNNVNEAYTKMSKFKALYIIMTILKSCLGLFILFKNKHIIEIKIGEYMSYLTFYIAYYTFLWPIAIVSSFILVVFIFSIDCCLKIIRIRSRTKLSVDNLDEIPASSSSYDFIYIILIIFIIISYIASVPITIYLLYQNYLNDNLKQIITASFIFTFFVINVSSALLVFSMFMFYTLVIRELNKKKLNINDSFIDEITKEVEISRKMSGMGTSWDKHLSNMDAYNIYMNEREKEFQNEIVESNPKDVIKSKIYKDILASSSKKSKENKINGDEINNRFKVMYLPQEKKKNFDSLNETKDNNLNEISENRNISTSRALNLSSEQNDLPTKKTETAEKE